MNARALALQMLITAMMVAVGITAYHRFLVSPSLRFGVVDVAEVYRLKEKQLMSLVTKPQTSEADKQRAVAMALEFTKSLPVALGQLPEECRCFVLVRSAVAGEAVHMVDLTPMLKAKVGI